MRAAPNSQVDESLGAFCSPRTRDRVGWPT
jgi:hypothetical protein